MTQGYKKRLKGSWTQGKRYKGDGDERQYAKAEIKQQLVEAEENYLDKYHKGSRRKNIKARLEYRVKWYEEALARRTDHQRLGDWWGNYLRDGLKKAKIHLEKYLEREKK